MKMIQKLQQAWKLLTSDQYFLVFQKDGNLYALGMNKNTVREADAWFDKVEDSVRVARDQFMKSL